jgi:acetylglutamate kinase
MTRVIKIGGNEMNTPGYLWQLAEQTARLAADEGRPPVVVHGGGQDIALWQTRLNLPTIKVDGLRVTDAESLVVAQMVLSGHTNKLIVKAMLAAGLTAIGLSGVDGALLRCHKKPHPTADLGLVGEIEAVNTALLTTLLDAGLTPVVSPISLGVDGLTYNVNADEAAGTIAEALGAARLDLVSNVPGVLNGRAILPSLTAEDVETLIDAGTIAGGMIPKVRTALAAVARGVPLVRIVNLAGLAAGGGTVFHTPDNPQGAAT